MPEEYVLYKSDLLVTMTDLSKQADTFISVRAPVGDINMAYEHCCVGRGVAAIRHKSGSRSFTYYGMHALGERFSRFEGEGTVFGSINKKQFNSLPYVAPLAGIIEAFENKVSQLDEYVRVNTEEIRTLSRTRDTLLPKLISGEVHIPNVEKPTKHSEQDNHRGLIEQGNGALSGVARRMSTGMINETAQQENINPNMRTHRL